jgi:hypothetical protein
VDSPQIRALIRHGGQAVAVTSTLPVFNGLRARTRADRQRILDTMRAGHQIRTA